MFTVVIREAQIIFGISSNSLNYDIINILWGDFTAPILSFWKDGHNCNYTWPHWVPLLLLPREDDSRAVGSLPSALEVSLSPSFWPPHSLLQHLPTHNLESLRSVFGLSSKCQALEKGKEILHSTLAPIHFVLFRGLFSASGDGENSLTTLVESEIPYFKIRFIMFPL